MCGQLGIAGSISGSEERLFQHLLIMNSLRGLDSTGAGSVKRHEVNGKPKMVVAKELGNPFNLLSITRKARNVSEDDFSDVLSGTQRAMLGHCRSKTIGEATRKNTHPFVFDGLMGTHNGTLDYQTQKTLTNAFKFGTDSEALFDDIAHIGLQETVKKLRKPGANGICTDAYALVWYDMGSNTINFLRNQERPLHFCFDKENKLLFWSSEYGHLYAVTRDNIKHNDKYIYSLQEDLHISWEIPEAGKAFGKARVAKMEGGVDPLAHWGKGSNLVDFKKRNGSNTTNGTTSGDNNYDIDSWHDPFSGFYKRINRALDGYEYANKKYGPWFTTDQKAWDDLSESEQQERVLQGKYPSTIDITKKIGKTLVKTGQNDLDESLQGLNGVYVEKKGDKTTVTVKEEIELAAMEKRFKLGNHTTQGLIPIREVKGNKVYYNKDNDRYVTFTFKGWQTKPIEDSWMRLDFETCPLYVPLPLHDINARHFYKHVGKGKNKIITYRGFQGNLLVRSSFEKIMKEGCVNCGRNPIWGNKVRFVDHDIFFCQFCERHEALVKSFVPAKKKALN